MNFVNLLVTNTVYYLEFGSILYFFVFLSVQIGSGLPYTLPLICISFFFLKLKNCVKCN